MHHRGPQCPCPLPLDSSRFSKLWQVSPRHGQTSPISRQWSATFFTEVIKLTQKSSCWKDTIIAQEKLALHSCTRRPLAIQGKKPWNVVLYSTTQLSSVGCYKHCLPYHVIWVIIRCFKTNFCEEHTQCFWSFLTQKSELHTVTCLRWEQFSGFYLPGKKMKIYQFQT